VDAGWPVAAVLAGLALFGFLRARDLVGETWGVRSGRSLLALGAIGLAVVVLLAVARSLAAVVIGATVVGLALYVGWRLRRT